MSDADVFGEAILANIKELGRTCTLVKVVQGTYAPGSGAVTGGTETEHTIRAMRMPYRSRDVDGTRISGTDTKVIVSAKALPAVPEVGDRIVSGGSVENILDVKTYEADGASFAFILQCRKIGAAAVVA